MPLHFYSTIRETSIDAAQELNAASSAANPAAELWIERFLNHLNACLQTDLSTEGQVWQMLANELSNAFAEAAAICLPSAVPEQQVPERQVLAQQVPEQFEVQHCAGMQSSASSFATGIGLGTLLSLSALQQNRQAWELCDRQASYGWLIMALSAEPIDQLQQLQHQCINRAIAQALQAIRQVRNYQAIVQQCQQLQAKNQELIQTSQRKSEFLANTSHEIRTPLTSILGFTHLLREQGYTPSNLRHQEYLKIILSSGQHLLALINDILDLSKIEANQLTLQPETIDVIEVCKLALKLVKEKANDKGLPLKLAVAPDVTTIEADPLRLKQMLFNLLSNALKFTDRGAVGLDVKLVDRTVQFSIWDTGTGISLEQQQLLFRPYTQLSNAHPGEGTGLGLALTQKLAELHGGWVRLESDLNSGSRFTIALPLASPCGSIPKPDAAALPIPTPTSTSTCPSILLVEDNLHNARLLIAYLTKLSYDVTWAKDSQTMWRSLKQAIPVVILMDIHLPGIDGLTLIQQLQTQQRYCSIPIIAQTAMAMKGDREKCLEAGACDYISKPLDLAQLAQTIAKHSQRDQDLSAIS